MDKPIPDYTESQVWTVAESLSPHGRKLTMVPGLYWQAAE